MTLRGDELIVDPKGWTRAELLRGARLGYVEDILRDSPRNLARLSTIRLVPMGRGTSVEVRVVGAES